MHERLSTSAIPETLLCAREGKTGSAGALVIPAHNKPEDAAGVSEGWTAIHSRSPMQQNGRHERMHLTLKKEATHPAGANILQQQAKFDAFHQEFNSERAT
ncbi:MAG: transposase [Acidobacteriaceae bacterium]|nr:transposase [Acidobacteriaceae bacterium]